MRITSNAMTVIAMLRHSIASTPLSVLCTSSSRYVYILSLSLFRHGVLVLVHKCRDEPIILYRSIEERVG